MERKIENIDELAAEIAEHSFQKHVLEKGEFISENLGQTICLSGKKEFAEHIKKTLGDDKTECFVVSEGYEKSTMFFYNEETNTYIVVPGNKGLDPSCFRPEDKGQRYEIKLGKTTEKQGFEPEIKHGIYELMPELKKEAVLERTPAHQQQQVGEALRARREQVAKMMRHWRENEQELDGGRGFER